MSGIFEASCIAGVTIFIDSLVFPSDKNICPSNTKEHDVNRFKSSALAIFKVSLRYLLKRKNRVNLVNKCRLIYVI